MRENKIKTMGEHLCPSAWHMLRNWVITGVNKNEGK
jgi:hypothetical protein